MRTLATRVYSRCTDFTHCHFSFGTFQMRDCQVALLETHAIEAELRNPQPHVPNDQRNGCKVSSWFSTQACTKLSFPLIGWYLQQEVSPSANCSKWHKCYFFILFSGNQPTMMSQRALSPLPSLRLLPFRCSFCCLRLPFFCPNTRKLLQTTICSGDCKEGAKYIRV